jgi:5-(carboxyamino)imidazole ribonucleotide synthase
MKIGVIGGGQLGRMLSLAGTPLGFEFIFLDPASDSCAAHVGKQIQANYDDPKALQQLAETVDIVTFEFENVPSETVAYLANHLPVYPNANSLKIARDRLFEKTLFKQLGIQTPPFANIESQTELDAAVSEIGLPAVLKTRTLGYDGKGQAVLRTLDDVKDKFAQLGNVPLILEGFIAFDSEVSMIAARSTSGETVFYPLNINTHRDGILRLSVCSQDHPLQKMGEDYITRVLDALDYVGVLAFEFFVVGDQLIANEIAPRVHNSGHWTIEGAIASQFENHIRAICGLPLGSTQSVAHVAMINCIGSIPEREKILSVKDAHIHHYAKAFKANRKVGHITVRAENEGSLNGKIKTINSL